MLSSLSWVKLVRKIGYLSSLAVYFGRLFEKTIIKAGSVLGDIVPNRFMKTERNAK